MENKRKIKKIKEKCYFCNKKLKIINFTCICGHKFCIVHLNPHSHNCSYDPKKDKQKAIQLNNPKINSKLQKI